MLIEAAKYKFLLDYEQEFKYYLSAVNGGALVSTGGCIVVGRRQSSNSLNWNLNVIAEDNFVADYAIAA